MIGLGIGVTRQPGRGLPPAPVVPFVAVTPYGEDGSLINNMPGLRVSIDNGPWQDLAAAGLTVVADGAELVVSGFADAAAASSARFHHEQEMPDEPYGAANSIGSTFTRVDGEAAPANPALPGFALAATPHDSPVVTA